MYKRQVLPDIKSVGVMGDERTYQRPIILRAVESADAMTADWAKLPYEVLGLSLIHISSCMRRAISTSFLLDGMETVGLPTE